MSDDDSGRSSRLRRRRKQSKEKAQDTVESETDEPSDTSNTSKPSKPDKTEEKSETSEEEKTSVKDERVGTYIYIPESQRDDLRDFAKVAQFHYDQEYDVELEKNRHLYPLVVQYGLDELDGSDASDVHEKLTAMGLVPTE